MHPTLSSQDFVDSLSDVNQPKGSRTWVRDYLKVWIEVKPLLSFADASVFRTRI